MRCVGSGTAALVALIGIAGLAGIASCERRTNDDGLSRLRREIAAREYEATLRGGVLQAPNRAHGLRTWFEPGGVRIEERAGGTELLALRLEGVGRPDALAPVAPGAVTSRGARVEIRRAGLVEWYLNSPAGLEQGFTLDARPEGDGPLVLALSVRGGDATQAGDDLRIRTHGARGFAYGEPVASDADGTALPIQLVAAAGDVVELRIDDTGAAYPIVIDPLLTSTWDAQLEASEAAAGFGTGIAGAGDVNGDGYADAIVGAPGFDAGASDSGAAFVFLGSAAGISGTGPLDAQALLEGADAGGRFGASVAGAGDVDGDGYADVIVGAPGIGAGQDDGAAFVFLGSPAGVVATAHARLDPDQADAQLGASVSGAGDVNLDGYADVVVGAPGYSAGEPGEGAAFVFLGGPAGVASATSASAHARIEADQAGAALGTGVAGAGDVNGDGYADVIAGAPLRDSSAGAAYLFHGGAAGIASGGPPAAAARLDGDSPPGEFGTSVAGVGDVNGDGHGDVMVGAPLRHTSTPFAGSAYLFHGGAAGVGDRVASDADARIDGEEIFGAFGSSAAGGGDVNGDGYTDVIAGAAQADVDAQDAGAAFVFLGGSSGIVATGPADAYALLNVGQMGSSLGSIAAADVDGDGFADVLAGSPGFDTEAVDAGAALASLGGLEALPAERTSEDADAVYEQAGNLIVRAPIGAPGGDVNGDGYDDVLIVRPTFDGFVFAGSDLLVFHGSAAGVDLADPDGSTMIDFPGSLGSRFPLHSAGDVNGDGYGDVIVSAREVSKVMVFHGSESGLQGVPVTEVAWSPQSGSQLGVQVGSAGDLNGDGYGDVFVTASNYAAPGTVYLLHGGPAGIASGFPWDVVATQLEANAWVAPAGDVDADGFSDLILGEPFYDVPAGGPEGAAFLFRGRATGIPSGDLSTADARFDSTQDEARFGEGVAGADVNGDGYSDLIIGAPRWDVNPFLRNNGAAFVFLGGAGPIENGDPTTAATQLSGEGASFGADIQPAGDVDGDGFADIAVHATVYEGTSAVRGAYIYRGSPSGIPNGGPADADSYLPVFQFNASTPARALAAGDVDGDGFGDLIGGEPRTVSGFPNGYGVLVFAGHDDARPVHARQHGLGGAPLQPLGTSEDGFRVSLHATHPQGRGAVNLEVEACALLVPFGDPGCRSEVGPIWHDSGTGGAVVSHTLTGVEPGLYRWRARALHAPLGVVVHFGAPPVAQAGPWRRLSAAAAQVDVRVVPVPEPGACLSLVSGAGLLAWLARRRSVRAGAR